MVEEKTVILIIWVLEMVQVPLSSEREQDLKMVHGAKDLSQIYRMKLVANRLSQSEV